MNAWRLSFAELQQEILEALRSQNPNWVQPDGASPIYDNYEARLTELLGLGLAAEDHETPTLGQGHATFQCQPTTVESKTP